MLWIGLIICGVLIGVLTVAYVWLWRRIGHWLRTVEVDDQLSPNRLRWIERGWLTVFWGRVIVDLLLGMVGLFIVAGAIYTTTAGDWGPWVTWPLHTWLYLGGVTGAGLGPAMVLLYGLGRDAVHLGQRWWYAALDLRDRVVLWRHTRREAAALHALFATPGVHYVLAQDDVQRLQATARIYPETMQHLVRLINAVSVGEDAHTLKVYQAAHSFALVHCLSCGSELTEQERSAALQQCQLCIRDRTRSKVAAEHVN